MIKNIHHPASPLLVLSPTITRLHLQISPEELIGDNTNKGYRIKPCAGESLRIGVREDDNGN
jgi:hypothetical protein